MRCFLGLFIFLISFTTGYSQTNVMDYNNPRDYVVGGIKVEGVQFLNETVLASLSGISVGEVITVPGDQITNAVKKYWRQGLFSDVRILTDSIVDNKIYLKVYLKEQPRIEKVVIAGVKKSERRDLEDKLELHQGKQVTESLLSRIEHHIINHFIEKGYFNAEVVFEQEKATEDGSRVNLRIDIDQNERVKIEEVVFYGNEDFKNVRLERVMKNTRAKRLRFLFKSSKLVRDDYKEDKKSLRKFYQSRGYRDFEILLDSIEVLSEKRMNLHIHIYEGDQYFYRNIDWVGNTKYSSEVLNRRLGIEAGDVYDTDLLENRLYIDEDAASSLYLNNGYLFSHIDPVEIRVEDDSIDLEMRVFEGSQARINRVIIQGNTKTNEHVVRRELRTYPGDLFSKDAIMRSARELAQLGHFDPEKINPMPIPNQEDGTVDIKYDLIEKSTDQLELSGGYGANMFIGTLGVSFNNFSIGNFFKKGAWRPVPSGDGQRLSLRAQTNGTFYQSYSMSFMEPWFGGKKPNSFSVSMHYTKYGDYQSSYLKKPSDKHMEIVGGSVGLGRRLRWPDDYFTLFNSVSFDQYNLSNYTTGYFFLSDGQSRNLSFTTTFGRNSVDQPIYPRRGANFSLTVKLTPPYSLINKKDYTKMSTAEKYSWVEYHKWVFNSKWFTNLIDKLVLYTAFEFGYLGFYNSDLGPSPFESFEVGGDGWSARGGYYYGRDLIALRGYENSSLTPVVNGAYAGNIYEKFSLELRYPAVLSPSATVYALAFFDAGDAWYSTNQMSFFDLKRSVGFGLRAFLPMFGMLGVDWGYGMDEVIMRDGSVAGGGNFHFIIGQQF